MGCFVKICGLTNEADVKAVAALRPDAIGFVFWPGSPRVVRADAVAQWTRELPMTIKKVGVFVDATPTEVCRTLETACLDIAQLHGDEPADAFHNFPYPLWRSVILRQNEALDLAAWSVDAYLIDTYSPTARGGTGELGDWDLARDFVRRASKRVLLAGGLNPANVRDAIRCVGPWGVDVSSGVERSPGRKDMEKVRAFIEKCRAE
jgi:phosphoribosylanthranilate isomerase